MAQLSKYQKAQARAKAEGYANDYARRKALETRRGVTSADKTYAANKRAQALGFRNAYERRRARALQLEGKALEAWQKARILAHFGISESTFNRVRRENRSWSRSFPSFQWTDINTYREAIDKDLHNWSEQRVGYILAFHAAIVNPKTNYDALKINPKFVPKGPVSRKIANKEQFWYLVKYANIMQINEFEARYGHTPVRDAANAILKP